MTDDDLRRRRLLIGGAVVAVVAAIGIALAVTGQSDDDASPDPSSTATSSSGPTTTESPETSTSAAPPVESPAATPDAPVPSPVPVPPIDSRPPVVVPPDETVDVDGVQVALTRLSQVTTSGSGPGEVSGPGVEVTISVKNAGSQSVDLSALTVNVYQGADGSPLASVTTDQDNRPVPAKVEPAATVTGTYRFVSAGSEDQVYAVVVDVSAGSNPVVYQGVRPS